MVQNIQMYKAKLIDGKLILTSTDIHVGDKVQEWYGNKLYREYIVDEIYQDKDSEGTIHTMIKGGNEAVDSKNCFKVVGEISPEATWVREGDEFDEDEVTEPMFKDVGSFKKYCYIKGPCGHFH